jgi:hypothetical protein
VYYSATFALDGILDQSGSHRHLPQHESVHAEQQARTNSELQSMIDAAYTANPVGTYDRHLVM